MKTAILSKARPGNTATETASQSQSGHVRLVPQLAPQDRKEKQKKPKAETPTPAAAAPEAASGKNILSDSTVARLKANCARHGLEVAAVIEAAVESWLCFAEARPEFAKILPGVLDFENYEFMAHQQAMGFVTPAAACLFFTIFERELKRPIEESTFTLEGLRDLVGAHPGFAAEAKALTEMIDAPRAISHSALRPKFME